MRTTRFTSKTLSAAMTGSTSFGLRSLCAVALVTSLAACGSSGSLRSDLGPTGTGGSDVVAGGGSGTGSGGGSGGTIVGGGSGNGTDGSTTGNTGGSPTGRTPGANPSVSPRASRARYSSGVSSVR